MPQVRSERKPQSDFFSQSMKIHRALWKFHDFGYSVPMTDQDRHSQDAPQAGPGELAKQREAERKARAAQKLRENLMRRKQQARSRRAGAADETNGLPAAKTDESC